MTTASTFTCGGKVFYSNNRSYLQGIVRGAEYVNDGPIEVGCVTDSDRDGYAFMVYLADTDESPEDIAFEFDE